MRRWDVINFFIKRFAYKSYLEIGVDRPYKNFEKIEIDNKEGVDPAGRCRYIMTSDDFFKQNKKKYDIIFIDGLHEETQVIRDVDNALKILNKDGAILIHDCNPKRERHQVDEQQRSGYWTGTVWKAFARLRMTRKNLYMKTVNTKFGVGIIRNGSQRLLRMREEDINYRYLRKRRRRVLNLISAEQLLEEFK